jgi:hypothetical protein
MEKVLIIGSGPSARQYTDYPYKERGWKIVCVNHGWQMEPNMDLWVTPANFKNTPGALVPENVDTLPFVRDYAETLANYGGHRECGYTITLAAGYNALWKLKPSVIAFLGCDMNYTPDANGHTHIYGVGLDIKENNIPDPERMVTKHGKGDPDYLNNIYKRFETYAEKQLCKVFNFSTDSTTKLPYTVSTPEDIVLD